MLLFIKKWKSYVDWNVHKNLKYVCFKLCGILWTFYSPKSLPIRINDCLIILRFSINQKTIVVKYCQLNFILSLFLCVYALHWIFLCIFHMKKQNYSHASCNIWDNTTYSTVQIIFLNHTYYYYLLYPM